MNEIVDLLGTLGPLQYALVSINVLLIIFARYPVGWLSESPTPGQLHFRVTLMRGVNLLIIAVVLYPIMDATSAVERTLLLKLAAIIFVIYLAYLTAVTAEEIVRQRYGRKHSTTAEGEQYSDTYHSRMLGLVLSVFIGIVALITVIRLAGFSSLLEAGGMIGFIGVFLALTQAAWAPDIISGLVLLNSDMVGEGDVIEIDATQPLHARVFKTKIFHTVLVDVIDNHRVMIRNSQLRDCIIHNLSRFASARGLREKLVFKIGYDVTSERVKKLFNNAFELVCNNQDIAIDQVHPLEIRVMDTGDHAVEWAIFYYIKDIGQRTRSRQLFIEQILCLSIQHRISLATPQTHVIYPADSEAISDATNKVMTDNR